MKFQIENPKTWQKKHLEIDDQFHLWSEEVWQFRSVNFSRFPIMLKVDFCFREKCNISAFPPCICSLATWELGSLDWEPAVSSAVKPGFWIILWRRENIFWTCNWCWYPCIFYIYSFWEFRKFRYCSTLPSRIHWLISYILLFLLFSPRNGYILLPLPFNFFSFQDFMTLPLPNVCHPRPPSFRSPHTPFMFLLSY